MFGERRRQQDRIEHLEREIRGLEGLVTTLAQRAGVDPQELARLRGQDGSGLSAEVRRLADADKTIQAIKVHRQDRPGLGLKEAKDDVDAYRASR